MTAPCPAMVHVAVRALRDFAVETRAEAEQALPTWPFYGQLSDAERDAVLARFDGQRWPECVHHRHHPLVAAGGDSRG